MISFSFPPGCYFIGDAYYALADDLCGKIFVPGIKEGIYTSHDGKKLALGFTSRDDTVFYGDDGYAFSSFACNISLVPWCLCDKLKHKTIRAIEKYGKLISSKSLVDFNCSNGTFDIKYDDTAIYIDTHAFSDEYSFMDRHDLISECRRLKNELNALRLQKQEDDMDQM